MTLQERNRPHLTQLRSNRRGSKNSQPFEKHVSRVANIGPPDVAALADLYNSPPASQIAREDLLEEARLALAKYELSEADLEPTANTLARAMHMLVEQRGVLEPKHKEELIRHVLAWHGLANNIRDDAGINTSEVFIRRPETPYSPLPD